MRKEDRERVKEKEIKSYQHFFIFEVNDTLIFIVSFHTLRSPWSYLSFDKR